MLFTFCHSLYPALYSASLEHVGVIIDGSNPKVHAHFGVSTASSLAGTTSEDEVIRW